MNFDMTDMVFLSIKIDQEVENMPNRIHGKVSTYQTYRCRGPLCREANRRYVNKRRIGDEKIDMTPGTKYAYLDQKIKEYQVKTAMKKRIDEEEIPDVG